MLEMGSPPSGVALEPGQYITFEGAVIHIDEYTPQKGTLTAAKVLAGDTTQPTGNQGGSLGYRGITAATALAITIVTDDRLQEFIHVCAASCGGSRCVIIQQQRQIHERRKLRLYGRNAVAEGGGDIVLRLASQIKHHSRHRRLV